MGDNIDKGWNFERFGQCMDRTTWGIDRGLGIRVGALQLLSCVSGHTLDHTHLTTCIVFFFSLTLLTIHTWHMHCLLLFFVTHLFMSTTLDSYNSRYMNTHVIFSGPFSLYFSLYVRFFLSTFSFSSSFFFYFLQRCRRIIGSKKIFI